MARKGADGPFRVSRQRRTPGLPTLAWVWNFFQDTYSCQKSGKVHIDSSKREGREGWEVAAIFLQVCLWGSEDAAEQLCSLSL